MRQNIIKLEHCDFFIVYKIPAMPTTDDECTEIIGDDKQDSCSFTQEVVKEAFGEELFTEEVKITLRNKDNLRLSADIYPSDPSADQVLLSTFKKTYFGATKKSQSLDESSLNKTSTPQDEPNEGKTLLFFFHTFSSIKASEFSQASRHYCMCVGA